MRYQVVLASIMLASSMTWAWTEAETNAVGHALAELTAISSGVDDMPLPPDDPAANEPVDEPYPNFESLFAGNLPIAAGWTADEKRAAFFHYLGSIPGTVTNGVSVDNLWHASSALGFCRLKGDATVLPYAEAVLSSTNVHESLEYEASMIFNRFAEPSIQMNSFIESVVSCTNRLKGTVPRRWIYSDYCNKLGAVYSAGHTNIARSGAAILYHGIFDHVSACSLDALLVKVYPSYETSSNRLWVATQALSSDPNEEWTYGYFANVTNQLISVGAPLSEVNGL